MDILNLVEEIIDSKSMIFLVKGSESFKLQLEESIDDEVGWIATIPRFLIEENNDNEDNDRDKLLLEHVTVKMLISKYLIIYLDSFDKLSCSKIKELVHGELFDLLWAFVDKAGLKPIKLIIVSELDFKGSFFPDDKALIHRCKFL